MKNAENDGTKGYRLASALYDPLIERWMRQVREKTLEITGLRPGDGLLDVCCGTGRQAELFAETGARVYGIDMSCFMFARAKPKEKKNLVFTQGDAAHTGYDESSFDFASMGFSLHEIDEETATGFLNEMARVTKPGGFLVFTDFSVQSGDGFQNGFRKTLSHTLEWLAGREHYRNYAAWMKKGGLAGFLSRKNLRLEKTIPLYGGHILIAKAINTKPL